MSSVLAEPKPIGPEHFFNREMSWLEFNQRVLEEAEDVTNPLLERVKFLSIFSSNLDEFMMVRLSGLRSQLQGLAEPEDKLPEQFTPRELFERAHERTRELVARQYRCLNEAVLPALREQGIRLLHPRDLTSDQKQQLDRFFRDTVFPVLTPMAIDPSHPKPHLRSRGLYLAAIIQQQFVRNGERKRLLAAVQLPQVLPRLIRLDPEKADFILLEDYVGNRLDQLFGGSEIISWTTMRITRDADFDLDGDQVLHDLSQAVEEGLKAMRHREVVRIEIASGTTADLRDEIVKPIGLVPQEIYEIDGPLDLTALLDLRDLPGFDALRDEPFTPRRPIGFEEGKDIFRTIRGRDVLIHLPYESFGCVLDFLNQAATDPDVLAIKQTLYRTGKESPVVRALINAAEQGKNVTAVVELLARFDEQSNVNWARQMERAGVHVVYGFVELKTHCKVTLVVRREGETLQRYVHLGTGNYNAATAKAYTDFGLFTCRHEFGEDATALFNSLTGYAQGHEWQCFTVSPAHLKGKVLSLIQRETEKSQRGEPGRIVAKLNALVDPEVITALYRASQAGVRCDLIVRGSCCLRPGVPGISENIRVTSILDRFLEHSRVYIFGDGEEPDVFVASADWMPRNFHRRVEVMFPVVDAASRRRLVRHILPVLLSDNVKARELLPDGTYRRVATTSPPLRAQLRLLEEQGGGDVAAAE